MDKMIEENLIEDVVNKNCIKRPVLKNSIKAFLIGGFICLLGEVVRYSLTNFLKIDEENSNTLMLLIIIFIASILTALGLYDKIGQQGGAGTIIPISGFANSLTSAALESKTEGFIQGILNNIFKVAGAVIATAVLSGTIVGFILFLFRGL